MALNRIKIGSIVTLLNDKNTSGEILQFLGLNKEKEFIQTIANTKGLDVRKYNILKRGYFAINGMHVGRDIALPLGLYNDDLNGLISPAYKTFKIDESIMIPEYFFMMFNSDEKARYCAFLCDGDVREGFDWDVFCNMEIDVPPIEIQKKYVAIYDSLLKNEKNYESSFDDLKRCFIAYIENLRRTMPLQKIDKYLIQTNERCENNLDIEIMGISNEHCFKEPNSRVDGVDISKYKIVKPMEFGWSPIHINEGSIALNTNDKAYAISPIYSSFKTDENYLLPKYLDIFFQRDEFTRYCWFNAFGSARDSMSWDDLTRIELPIPSLKTQESIANIFTAYTKRKEISEKLKKLIKNICPILIKGSITEASKL